MSGHVKYPPQLPPPRDRRRCRAYDPLTNEYLANNGKARVKGDSYAWLGSPTQFNALKETLMVDNATAVINNMVLIYEADVVRPFALD